MLPANASLLESLLWQPNAGYFLRDEHRLRLRRSAGHFGIALSETRIDRALNDCAQRLAAVAAPASRKVRLLIDAHGEVSTTDEPVKPSTPVRLALAKHPLRSDDELLRHKTTARASYDAAMASVRTLDVHDVLLWNEREELTETASANIVLHLDGELLTPHSECGLLPGTLREVLLRQGAVREAVLPVAALERASALWIVNSVRKWCRAYWNR